jgi:hypothetical protein
MQRCRASRLQGRRQTVGPGEIGQQGACPWIKSQKKLQRAQFVVLFFATSL